LERALRADAGREKEPPAERPQPKTVEDKGAQTPLKADAQA
jgi:hypothetical protein